MTLSWNPLPPAVTDVPGEHPPPPGQTASPTGLVLMVGVGPMAKTCAFDVAPAAVPPGFTTVTSAVPDVVRRFDRTSAVSWLPLTKLVISDFTAPVPSVQFTVEPFRKLLP